MVDITLLKFNLASQTVYLLSPLAGPALLIYHDQLPTLMVIIHFLVQGNERRAAGISAGLVEGAWKGRKGKRES